MRVRIKASPEWDGSVWLGKEGEVIGDVVHEGQVLWHQILLDKPVSRKQPTIIVSLRNLEFLDADQSGDTNQ